MFVEKKGFFDNLFGGDKPKPESKTVNQKSNSYMVSEEKWSSVTPTEEAFFMEAQRKRKEWIGISDQIKAQDLLKKELLDFSLNNNLLNSVLYEHTFRRFNLRVKESIDASRRIQFFYSLMEEVLRGVLQLEKRRAWIKKEIKDNVQADPEFLVSKVNELECTKEAFNPILEKVERSQDAGVDQIYQRLRMFVEKIMQGVAKDVAEYSKLKQECESEIIQQRKVDVDPVQLAQRLEGGFSRFETELRSEAQIIKLNFFSLYEPDLEKMELHFNQCFEGCDRIYLNSVRHDKRCESDPKLTGMIEQFEEVDYFLKKLVSSMKRVSISCLAIFSNLRFGSSNFLTEDQSSKNESEVLLSNLKETLESSRLILDVIKKKLQAGGTSKAATTIIQYFNELFTMVYDLSGYLLVVYETLYQQWFTVNKEFKRLTKEKDVGFWFKNLKKFQAAEIDEAALAPVMVNKQEFLDLNAFLEE